MDILWERLLKLHPQFVFQIREHLDVDPYGGRVPCIHQTMSSGKPKLFG